MNETKFPHQYVKRLVSLGVIKRSDSCAKCNSTKNVVAHHEDYSKPDVVEWLCRSCHSKRHAEIGKGKNWQVCFKSTVKYRSIRVNGTKYKKFKTIVKKIAKTTIENAFDEMITSYLKKHEAKK